MSLRLFEDGDALPGKDAFAKRKPKTVVGKYIDSSSRLAWRIPFRGQADFADKLFSAMRYEFGGQIEKPAAK